MLPTYFSEVLSLVSVKTRVSAQLGSNWVEIYVLVRCRVGGEPCLVLPIHASWGQRCELNVMS